MNSSEVPAYCMFCDICDIQCDSLKSLRSHERGPEHTQISRSLAEGIFGYVTYKPITSLYHLFKHHKRRGSFIGLQYLITEFTELKNRPNLACILCGVTHSKLAPHLHSTKHKSRYITNNFSFLFEDGKRFSPETIEKIAMIIEEVEGFEKFKVGIKNLNGDCLSYPVKSSNIDNLSRQTVDQIIKQLQIHEIAFINPYEKGNELPQLQTGSLASGTNEKRNINTSVPSEPSAASEITSKQVNDKIGDKRQIHRIEFKDACRKENDVPSLQAGLRDFAINVNSGKRPLLYAPLTEFKRCKSELPSHHAEKPISLTTPVPEEFFFPGSSLCIPVSKNVHGHNSLQENKLRTTSYVPLVNESVAPKPIPSLCSSHTKWWVYETTRPPADEYSPSWPPAREYSPSWPPAGKYSPSWPPAVSFYQNAKYEYGNSDQSLYKFANKSAYEQASSDSDFGKANAFEGQTWGLETGHLGAQHLQTLGATGSSVESLNGPSSSVAYLNHDAVSRYGYISVDSKEFFSNSSLPPGINLGLNQVLTSTSLHAQTSQSTNSRMPTNAASMLSPAILKILQGTEPEAVKSILKRLSGYCPELQQVNISLLVDVLFEIGALR